jgi:hypothetical protein
MEFPILPWSIPMTGKSISLLLCTLGACLLCACPKSQESSDSSSTAAPTASAPASPHGAADNPQGAAGSAGTEEAATPEYDRSAETEAAMQTVRSMVQALVDGNAETFKACFHPESKELAEMTAMYEDWQGSGNTISIESLSVDTAMAGHAIVDYEFSIVEVGKEAESEKGKMEMLLDEAGSWVIMDIN